MYNEMNTLRAVPVVVEKRLNPGVVVFVVVVNGNGLEVSGFPVEKPNNEPAVVAVVVPAVGKAELAPPNIKSRIKDVKIKPRRANQKETC